MEKDQLMLERKKKPNPTFTLNSTEVEIGDTLKLEIIGTYGNEPIRSIEIGDTKNFIHPGSIKKIAENTWIFNLTWDYFFMLEEDSGSCIDTIYVRVIDLFHVEGLYEVNITVTENAIDEQTYGFTYDFVSVGALITLFWYISFRKKSKKEK
ncbi:MAG: hypothetical protein ACTSPG_05710 [Candidatus Hodarchaeales archaeon]